MTREEFKKGYMERAGMTEEEFHRNHVTMRCSCGEGGCEGQARILNYPDVIEDHKRFYTPKE